MISFKTGNLFTSDAEALVNPVNCVGVMGKGVAALMKKEFPFNFEVYREACKMNELEPGKLLSVWDGNVKLGRRLIINFPTKLNWLNKSSYLYIEQGLLALPFTVSGNNIKSVAMPMLGCGEGGLNPEEVSIIMLKHLIAAPFDTTVFMVDNNI